ncbi:MAG: GNAT family N-acetyltransferase [Hyphomicrobiaceae bacterium]
MNAVPSMRLMRAGEEERLLTLMRGLQAALGPMFDRMHAPEDIGRWYLDLMLAECAAHKGVVLIAEDRDEWVGYAILLKDVPSDDEPDEIAYSYAYLAELYVDARLRGEGLGQLMIAQCERLAREAGARWLRVTSLAANVGAMRLYRRAGFRDHLVTLEKPLN